MVARPLDFIMHAPATLERYVSFFLSRLTVFTLLHRKRVVPRGCAQYSTASVARIGLPFA